MAIGSPPPEGGERLRGGDTAKQWTTTRIKTARGRGMPCRCLESARHCVGSNNPRGKRRVGGSPSLASQGGSLLDTNSSTDFVRSASFVSSSVGRLPCATKKNDARARVEEQKCHSLWQHRRRGQHPAHWRSATTPTASPSRVSRQDRLNVLGDVSFGLTMASAVTFLILLVVSSGAGQMLGSPNVVVGTPMA